MASCKYAILAEAEGERVYNGRLYPTVAFYFFGPNLNFYSFSFLPLSSQVFDDIRIEDPRVTEFCNKTTEPSPNAILLTCLQRNYGSDVQITQEINRTANNKNEFTMTVGKHTAKVVCKNKREGKQLASQAILQVRSAGVLIN